MWSSTKPSTEEASDDAPPFDRREQLEQVQAALLPGEIVEAVFDLKGTGGGFIGITSHRLIIYDKCYLRKMKALVSIPYDRLLAVATEAESGLLTGRGFLTSKLMLTTVHEPYELALGGADTAHIAHKMILANILSR